MRVRCPAKVNLFLSVGPPEPGGYHPVRTVYQAVGLWDELEIEEGEIDEIVCDWAGLPAQNTITLALRLLRELVPVPPLRISLTKRIPVQAGLGGGSSNAAGVVRAIKAMYPGCASDQFARQVAAAVGSDVPFFLVGGRARGTGHGERIEPLANLDTNWLLIVKPKESVSTADAYGRLDGVAREWREFSDELYNDFERVAPCTCRELKLNLLARGARAALLCGSGSAVFGLFDDSNEAEAARSAIVAEGFANCWVAPTLTRKESLWTS